MEDKNYILHSKYDPVNESNNWLKNFSKTVKENENILIIGIGAGYHVKHLMESYPKQKILVIEFNSSYFSWFIESEFYTNLVNYQNLIIKSFSSMPTSEQQQLFTSYSSTNIGIHKSALDILPTEYLAMLPLLKDLQFHQNTVIQKIDILNENFKTNISLNDPSLSDLNNIYQNKAAILVSAGPSLNKQLPLLRDISEKKNVVICAVGTAIKPLLSNNIVPDLFMISDPMPATLTQLSGTLLYDAKFLYLSTAYPETVLLHSGKRYIVYQSGFLEAEDRAKHLNEPVVQTGGSVATCLLDTIVCLGSKSIALIGQDLAYTDGKSHADGAHLQKEIPYTTNQIKVINYDRSGYVNSSKNLSLYRQWFERYARENSALELYNCTEGGSHINNWKHISLECFVKLQK